MAIIDDWVADVEDVEGERPELKFSDAAYKATVEDNGSLVIAPLPLPRGLVSELIVFLQATYE